MIDKFKAKHKESGIVYSAWESKEGWDGYWFTSSDGLVPSKELSYLGTQEFWSVFDKA